MAELYIGLMSGTSVDGIDAGLIDFSHSKPKLIAFECTAFPNALKEKIKQLSSHHALLLKDYGALDCQLGHVFADAVNQLLKKSGIAASEIIAIGSHGQTLFHEPNNSRPFSLQIGDPNIIVEKTNITTVADFRRRDIAANGQGAPLAPAFHQAVFTSLNQSSCVVNIGGIANITLKSNQQLIAFDTGVGNTLMDYWCQKHLNKAYDDHGNWAKSGAVIPKLLQLFKQADYFQLPAPKSTGKEYFSTQWLENHLTDFSDCNANDIQATLCQLTAESIADAIQNTRQDIDELLICGGGVHNHYLLSLLTGFGYQVNSTKTVGIHPDHVEAIAFAWLAKQTINHNTGNLPDVTGANRAVILGGIYPKTNPKPSY
ncbi:MAG: anhydro-N-acetylmuramic acid kinase [Methylococcales bacterium]|nr:anhydro-N-acetylmuramic acid kinase [Methylococcales bacterium]